MHIYIYANGMYIHTQMYTHEGIYIYIYLQNIEIYIHTYISAIYRYTSKRMYTQ